MHLINIAFKAGPCYLMLSDECIWSILLSRLVLAIWCCRMNAFDQHCVQGWSLLFDAVLWMHLINIAFKAGPCYLMLSDECIWSILLSRLVLAVWCCRMNAFDQYCVQGWSLLFDAVLWMHLINTAFKAGPCYLMLSDECIWSILRSRLVLAIWCCRMNAFDQYCVQGWSLLFDAVGWMHLINIAFKAGPCYLMLSDECIWSILLSRLVLAIWCCRMNAFDQYCFQGWSLLFDAVGWMHLINIVFKAGPCYLMLSYECIWSILLSRLVLAIWCCRMNAFDQHCFQGWSLLFDVVVWMHLINIAFKAGPCCLMLSDECICPTLLSKVVFAICCCHLNIVANTFFTAGLCYLLLSYECVQHCDQGWSLLFAAVVSMHLVNTVFKAGPCYLLRMLLLSLSFKADPCYSEPLLQRQHLFPKILTLKWICCCKESLKAKMICKNNIVLFLFPHRTYKWGDFNKYPEHVLLEVLMQIFA